MFIETLEVFNQVVSYTLLAAWVVTNMLRAHAVGRSELHFKFTTASLGIGIFLEISVVLRAVFALMRQDYAEAGGWLPPGVILLVALYVISNDNNWFNDQFKKLKRGIKKLGSRLSRIRIALPSPLPTPA